MELLHNELWFCGELNGVNLSEDQAGKYISIEFKDGDPAINIYLSKEDLSHFFERMEEINDEYFEMEEAVEY